MIITGSFNYCTPEELFADILPEIYYDQDIHVSDEELLSLQEQLWKKNKAVILKSVADSLEAIIDPSIWEDPVEGGCILLKEYLLRSADEDLSEILDFELWWKNIMREAMEENIEKLIPEGRFNPPKEPEARFKYRVYDKVNKRYGLSIYIQPDMGDGYILVPPAAHDDRYVIEQCTGKTDRDGTLIFEGDLVTLFPVDNEEHRCRRVVWDKAYNRWAVQKRDAHGELHSWWLDNSHDFVIVGNVHKEEVK